MLKPRKGLCIFVLLFSAIFDAFGQQNLSDQQTNTDSLRKVLEGISTIQQEVDRAELMIEELIYKDSAATKYLMDHIYKRSKEESYHRGYIMVSAYYAEFMAHHNVPGKGEKIIREILSDQTIPANIRVFIEASLGNSLVSQHKYALAEELFKEVLKNDEAIREIPSAKAAAINNLAIIYDLQGHYTKAIDYYFIMLKEPKLSPTVKTDVLINLSTCFNEMGDISLAIVYGKQALQALKVVDSARNRLSHVIVTGNLAEFYLKRGDMDSASAFSQKSLKIARSIDDLIGIGHGLRILGSVSLSLENFAEALSYFEESLQINLLTKNQQAISVSSRSLAETYFVLGQLREALTRANESLSFATSASLHREMRDSHHLLYQIHENGKNIDSAFFHYRKYTSLRDSIYNLEKSKEIASIRTEYETDKKEQEIASLSQQATIQTLELEQKNQNLIVSGILISCLVLGLAMVYLVYRQRQLSLSRKAEEVEQRLLRLQMNPHFIFNSLSSIQEFVLSGDEKSASRYLTKFSRLIREVLDHSRSEYISLDQEVSLLENYLSLQNLKRSVPFEYEIIVDDKIDKEELAIPPMFAQPFIENANRAWVDS